MSTTRYDAIAARTYQDRDGNDKSSFTNIGVAFPMKDRDGFTIRLHAMPAPVDGEYSILLMPPKPRDDQPAKQQDRSGGDYAGRSGGGKSATPAKDSYGNSNFDDDPDSIPF